MYALIRPYYVQDYCQSRVARQIPLDGERSGDHGQDVPTLECNVLSRKEERTCGSATTISVWRVLSRNAIHTRVIRTGYQSENQTVRLRTSVHNLSEESGFLGISFVDLFPACFHVTAIGIDCDINTTAHVCRLVQFL